MSTIITMDFNAALFDMYDPTGARVGGSDDVHGSLTIDMATGAGTATVASDQLCSSVNFGLHTMSQYK